MNNKGFTMVEMIISLVILGAAVMGVGSATARLSRTAMEAEKSGLALQAVEDRISRIRLHPVYQQLGATFTESEVDVDGFPDYTRSTSLTRVIQAYGPYGKSIDYTQITVTVNGPGLAEPVSRTVAIGVS